MAHLHLQRALPFRRAAVYDVIADVARYPDFMPGFKGVRLDGWEDDADGGARLRVVQTVGGGGLTVTFLSHARFDPERRIDIVSRDRPFHHLDQTWRFEDIAGGRTRVHLEADYAMADRLAGMVFERVFPSLLRGGLTAVGRRAADLERRGTAGARSHPGRRADHDSRRGHHT
jgi:coenzyme Q-binding protein COQ10